MNKSSFLDGKNHFKIMVQNSWCEYNALNEILEFISNKGWVIHFVDNGNISCTKERIKQSSLCESL